MIYTAWSNDQPRPIASNGAVRQPHSPDTIAWWRDGALLTTSDDIAAVVEFPTLDGLPDDFIPTEVDPSEEIPYTDWDREPPSTDAQPPPCTGRVELQTGRDDPDDALAPIRGVAVGEFRLRQGGETGDWCTMLSVLRRPRRVSVRRG